MSNPRAVADSRRLQSFFADDARFNFRGLIAHGNYGTVSRVGYNDPENKFLDSFLVKQAFGTQGAEDAMKRERDYLKQFRGSMHIVQIIEIPNNPLGRPTFEGEWIILEWLEYGTIGDFITKARNKKVKRLPNRLLWRYFLCLIKACIGMAWPKNRTDGVIESEELLQSTPESNLVHNDLHLGNVLLGEPLAYPSANVTTDVTTDVASEHQITPLLKVIDFGLTGKWKFHETSSGSSANVYDIAEVMVALITLIRWPADTPPAGSPPTFAMFEGGLPIMTDAYALFPEPGEPVPYPLLDPWLRTLVCACLSMKNADRPSLSSLAQDVSSAVLSRDEGFYPGRPEEGDEAIATLWREIVHFAETENAPIEPM